MHLYSHIPFCTGKCAYCGFYSVKAPEEEIRKYPDLLFREYIYQEKCFPDQSLLPDTWYLGGGTPSLLGEEGMRYLAKLFSQRFDPHKLREWSVEVNPASTTEGLPQTLREIGVTRISIGAQSFNNAVLQRAGRKHTSQDILRVIRDARSCGFSDVGIDLIAGLPLSTEQIWEETLQRAIDLDLRHLSVYALTLEPRTRFAVEAKNRKEKFLDDDRMMDQISCAERFLTQAGFERYEISNYARPKFECQYNLAVWRGEDYLGIGPAAASRIGSKRWTHAANLAEWETAVMRGNPIPNTNEEQLGKADDLLERNLYRFRLQEGVQKNQIPPAFWKDWEPILQQLAKESIAEEIEPDHWCLTSRGREVCDSVLEELLARTDADW